MEKTEPLYRWALPASKQPPLAFFGREFLVRSFMDDETGEKFMTITVYKIESCQEPEMAIQSYTDDDFVTTETEVETKPQEECLIIYKEVFFQDPTYGTWQSYIILKHPDTENHDELFDFCLQKTPYGKHVSSDYLSFIRTLGLELANDPFYFYNNKPWRTAK